MKPVIHAGTYAWHTLKCKAAAIRNAEHLLPPDNYLKKPASLAMR